MLIEKRLGDPRVPSGVRIERMTEERHARDFAALNIEAYQGLGLRPENARLYFGRRSELLSERNVGFIAYRGEEPVSGALTILSGASAGVYWVGTIASAQRLGLGGLCTTLATNAGFAAGARVVTLQASIQGAPLYRRLGYRPYDRMKWYGHPAPS